MANFNLADYELVETRISKFYSLYEDGRIETENMSTAADREKGIWVVKARLYVSQEDQRLGLAKATGYAFEVDGGYGANKTSALENCETSAIGRALANMALHGSKRASREEMSKVERAVTPPKDAPKWDKPLIVWEEELEKLDSVEGARGLFALAKAEGASKAVLEAITAKGKMFTLEDK
jgi:hypothetical protein